MTTAFDQTREFYTGKGQFTATHWTVVLAARGYPDQEAQDLTQGFFARLLEKEFLSDVDRSKGKFRSFLLAAMEHFLANEWRRANAQKRGGGVDFVPLAGHSAEGQSLQISAPNLSPEDFFDQQWAITVLEHAVSKLRQEFTGKSKEEFFEKVKIYLTGEKPEASYTELAARLDTTAAALKMAVSRIRQRYGELLREEIASTVSDPNEVEEELRALLAALSR